MTENQAEVKKNEISVVAEEYDKWKDVEGVPAVGQALHPAVLNSLRWEKDTSKKVAELILSKARQEIPDWVDERKGLYHLEQSDYYEKVHEVRKEIRRILRKEKEKEKVKEGLVVAESGKLSSEEL